MTALPIPDETPDITAVLDGLTVAQKALLTGGADYWQTVALPEAGVPPLKMTDGPVGARGNLSELRTSICFPCGAAVGATWDTALARRFGAALAEEAKAKGAQLLLAPTVNLQRHPFAGRNFECLSEDPELTGRLAAALIAGLQAAGVGACVKHFVANDQETERMTISADVDERTLREVYLRPFEAAVAEASPWSIMAAYNKVNGAFATENSALLRDLLKTEWKWDGVVVSDWWATHSGAPALAAGLDLEMPGGPLWLGDQLLDAIAAEECNRADLDDAVLRLLRLLERTGRFLDPTLPPERSDADPERTELARRIARESIVLLRNGGILPLPVEQLTSLAVIGPGADPGFSNGGGSSLVWPHRRISPLDALRDALPGVTVRSARGCGIGRLATPLHPDLLRDGGWQLAYWPGSTPVGDPVFTESVPEVRYSFFGRKVPGITNPSEMSVRAGTELTPDVSGDWTFELSCAGRARVLVDGAEVLASPADEPTHRIFSTDLPLRAATVVLTAGRPVAVDVEFSVGTPGCLPHLYVGGHPPDPAEEIDRAAALAAECDAAVVFVGTGAEFESEGFDRTSLALPGDQDRLVRAVLAAQPRTVVVVSAGAALDLPWRDEVPALLLNWFGGQEAGPATADVLLGLADPGGRLPMTWPQRIEDVASDRFFPGEAGVVRYGERLDVGHRWHARTGVAPAFAFGEGLSYTSFTWSNPLAVVAIDGDEVLVDVTVSNVGDRPGHDVVQIYAFATDDPTAPVVQLAGFTKVYVAPGESRVARVRIPIRALAWWDGRARAWRVPGGRRRLGVARNAERVEHVVTVELTERLLPTPQR